jgi:peroxiredoxin
MSLTQDLEALRREQQVQFPPIVNTLFDQLVRDLKANGVGQGLKVGDEIPAFELPNALGRTVSSSELLARGPLVVVFYRGAWCPFCNLELKALQDSLGEFHELGAELVAISPMTPDNSLSLAEKHGLEFEVLSDRGLKVAAEFGLTYTLPLEIKTFLQKAGIDLSRFNGDGSWKLPVPATYVTDHDGIVIAEVNPDWRNRLDPLEIIAALQKL